MRAQPLIYRLGLALHRNKRRQQKKPNALASTLANDAIFLLCNALKIEPKYIGYLGRQGHELERKISSLKRFPGGSLNPCLPRFAPPTPSFFIPPSIVSFLWLPSTMTNATLHHNNFCQPASSSNRAPADQSPSFLLSRLDSLQLILLEF